LTRICTCFPARPLVCTLNCTSAWYLHSSIFILPRGFNKLATNIS
jgi:hypothetical protein